MGTAGGGCPHVVAGSVKLRHYLLFSTVGSQPGRRYNSSKSAPSVQVWRKEVRPTAQAGSRRLRRGGPQLPASKIYALRVLVKDRIRGAQRYQDSLRSLYDGTGDNRGFDFEYRSTPRYSMLAVSWFICRCEISATYWRSSFDGLMGSRLELWAAGCTQQKTCDMLGIKRTALLWLDKHIRENFI